eukprot:TRINITY_DN49171_c0_g1_i1.p1 TRINITY_DN49171_c0_g1~~TRINITY_DN49171_c0_g1_i1.p1  ORF type:complete len:240 (+),score=60.89 TRINITY_DN49171_c0_g1_i1:78-722(+)
MARGRRRGNSAIGARKPDKADAAIDDDVMGQAGSDPAEGDEDGAETTATSAAEARKLSRGQRKRGAKKENFLRKLDFIGASMVQNQARREGAFADFATSLSGAAEQALNEGSAASAPQGRKRPMSRKALALSSESEIGQFQQVLQVDAFRKDPLEALGQHLRNSLTKQREEEKRRREALQAKKRPAPGKAQASAARAPGAPKRVINSKLKKKRG